MIAFTLSDAVTFFLTFFLLVICFVALILVGFILAKGIDRDI